MRPEPFDSRSMRIATMLCVLAFAGAIALPAIAAESAAGMAARPAAKPQAQPVWVRSAAKHGGSGIDLRYSLPESLQANQPATLQLQFGGIAETDAGVELRTPSGVTLTDANGAVANRLTLPRGQITTLSLRVTAATDGMQFIDVFTTQGGRSSAQSVPLKVGKGEMALKKTGDLRIEPNGERVISMPAQ